MGDSVRKKETIISELHTDLDSNTNLIIEVLVDIRDEISSFVELYNREKMGELNFDMLNDKQKADLEKWIDRKVVRRFQQITPDIDPKARRFEDFET